MSMRRLIGISLACLVTSACATEQMPEESTSRNPREVAGSPQGNGETPTGKSSGGSPDRPLRTTGISLFGRAAWYNLVGRQTASGEILDAVTPTAAHRSLPLASFAKVTNLDNGRSVVVKINDRGPYTRGRILDLSPRAADILEMKRPGIAAVAVEPLGNQTPPTVAVLQTYGMAMTQ